MRLLKTATLAGIEEALPATARGQRGATSSEKLMVAGQGRGEGRSGYGKPRRAKSSLNQ